MAWQQDQITTGTGIMRECLRYATAKKWSRAQARRLARLAIMCAMDESSLRNLANRAVPGSMELDHDGVGSDHASVGPFQQQVPGWGPVARCQNVAKSTEHFLEALTGQHSIGDLMALHGNDFGRTVQGVQRSATADGSNYQRYLALSREFLDAHWGGIK